MRLALGVALAATLVAASHAAVAKPLVVERILAVVDDGVILQSEVATRARPFKKRAAEMVPPDKLELALLDVDRQVLSHIVDERLVAAEAARRRITVGQADLDKALDSIALQNKTTIAAVLAEAAKNGYDAAEYKAEVMRQVLEGKLLFLILPRDEKRPRTTEAVEQARNAFVEGLRQHAYVDIRL